MPNYIDSFILPLPEANLDTYRKVAMEMGELWKKHGALEYHEFVADDVKEGKETSFPQAVKAKEGETVILSYVVYQSREHRDEVMEKVMQDPYMKSMKPEDMPFDGMRMFWGGFKSLFTS